MIRAILACALTLFIVFLPFAGWQVKKYPQVNQEPWQHYALLRLEDVGPGGLYSTPEGLGRLRAVLEELSAMGVPYHVAMIPDFRTWLGQAGWYDQKVGEGPIGKPFLQIIKNAQEHGAVIGMHGYSHQFGDVPRPDGQENTGFGREFDLPNEPASTSPQYAAARIQKSLDTFEKWGIRPGFWEAPHYAATEQQQEVFRSYIGLLYQPDWRSLQSLRDIVYHNETNSYGNQSLGSVYVPAPLKYIHDESSLKVLLGKLPDYGGIASFYFHPFMDFSYLEPVMEGGKPVLRDGIPVYRYINGQKSLLHRLIGGVREKGYHFASIHEIVPFTPAHRWVLTKKSAGANQSNETLVGDVNGDGRDDFVEYEPHSGTVTVLPSNAKWPRNTPQLAEQTWLRGAGDQNLRALLWDANNDGKIDFLLYDPTTYTATVHLNVGGRFDQQGIPIQLPQLGTDLTIQSSSGSAKNTLLAVGAHEHRLAVKMAITTSANREQWTSIKWPSIQDKIDSFWLGDVDGDRHVDILAVTARGAILVAYGGADGFDSWKSAGVISQPTHALVQVADVNGDGKSDIVVYEAKTGTTAVYHSDGVSYNQVVRPLSPWAYEGQSLFVGDFDGNGKSDIAIYRVENGAGLVDLALSDQRSDLNDLLHR